MRVGTDSNTRLLVRLALRCTLLLCLVFAPVVHTDDFMVPTTATARIEQQYGTTAYLRIKEWHNLIKTSRNVSHIEKLRRVNTFINQVAFIHDIDHWGVEDYWATPQQFLATNGGDCEDFSIAKYFTLRQMGIPAENLRLTYVKALKLNQAHMVLTYFESPGADPLVLDNLNTNIQKSSSRDDLLPVYSFNGEGLWLAKARGIEQRVGKPERLSRWKEVVARINTEQAPSVGTRFNQ